MQRLQAQDPPSAQGDLDRLRSELAGRRPAFFLDYDGTLTPIVERPELALLPAATREVLRRLAERHPVVVVSGRGREDVARLVDLPGLAYAGSHGLDIAGPASAGGGAGAGPAGEAARLRFAPAAEAEPAVAAIARELEADLAGVPGAQVEPKRFSVAVHYRRVDPERVADMEALVDRRLAAHSGLRRTHGKKVWELRPDLDWDKGRAVVWILETLGLDRPDVLPIYVGDDVTDEDAFRALDERGDRGGRGGVGVLVAEEPRKTAARFRLRDPDEVRRFLEGFVEERTEHRG